MMMANQKWPKHVVDTLRKYGKYDCVMTAMSMHNCYFMFPVTGTTCYTHLIILGYITVMVISK
jgi:hypothetical protein